MQSLYSVVVEYCIFAGPGIKSYKDGISLKINIQVFSIFYQKFPKILSQANFFFIKTCIFALFDESA